MELFDPYVYDGVHVNLFSFVTSEFLHSLSRFDR